MAVRRVKRWRRKYSVEEVTKRFKKLLPVMYPQMEFALTIWDKLEQMLFPKFAELGIPEDQYPFYMAWAKRKAIMGLTFSGGTRAAEAQLLHDEFVARGLDSDKLDALEPIVDQWIQEQWGVPPTPPPPPVAKYLYVGLESGDPDESRGAVVKVDLLTWSKIATLCFDVGELSIYSLTVCGSYLYAGCCTAPAKIVKVDLTTFTKVATLTLDSGENYVYDLVNDGVYLYAALSTSPAKIVKVDLTTFTKVATLTLAPDENYARALALTENYLYAGVKASNDVGKIVKIRLSNFSREAVLTLKVNEQMPQSLTVYNGFLYVGLGQFYNYPARVVKIDLSTFTTVGTYPVVEEVNSLVSDLHASGDYLYVSVIVPAYIGGELPDHIVKVKLENMEVVDCIDLDPSSFSYPTKFIIYEGYLYCGFYYTPARICKVDLSTFTVVDSLIFDRYERYSCSVAISTVG